ncbi:MAG: hypothetical protein WAW17_06855 [Rhodococcus sp. (in: high G+C Gram-positive bacteria)]|uniref:hypothetical protein n=1 Tax=Rhodococcus sp. TaxID=1831 RepID=UPI003BAF8F9F
MFSLTWEANPKISEATVASSTECDNYGAGSGVLSTAPRAAPSLGQDGWSDDGWARVADSSSQRPVAHS